MYSRIGVPPIVSPSVHCKPISVLIVLKRSYPKLAGGLGTTWILAVPPIAEGGEFPYSLNATILTLTYSPS